MLEKDPKNRLGSNGDHEYSSHPYFECYDWAKLESRQLDPPYKPPVKSATDVQMFDREFTDEVAVDSLVTPKPEDLIDHGPDPFQGYHYNINEKKQEDETVVE